MRTVRDVKQARGVLEDFHISTKNKALAVLPIPECIGKLPERLAKQAELCRQARVLYWEAVMQVFEDQGKVWSKTCSGLQNEIVISDTANKKLCAFFDFVGRNQ